MSGWALWLAFFARRLSSGAAVILAIATASFFLMRAAPGGPFDAERTLPAAVEQNLWATYGMAELIPASASGVISELLAERGTEVSAGQPLALLDGGGSLLAPISAELLSLSIQKGAAVRQGETIGALKTPLWRQYLTTLGNYARLDFGATFTSGGQRTVAETIFQSAPISAELGLWAMALALLLGVPAGLLAGWRANSWLDHTAMSLSMVAVSLSAIVLGPLLIAGLSTGLGWLAWGGWRSSEVKVLPILTLGLIYAGWFARLARGGMVEIISQDFIRTARAKGAPEWRVVTHHALRGAVLPCVTFLGPGLAGILAGSVVIERMFNIPGVSEYFVSGALNRDYPLVMGVVLLYSCLLVGLNILVDAAYALLDPRVTHAG